MVMRTIKRLLRPLLRVVGVGLVVVGAVLASTWFETLLQAATLGNSGPIGTPAEASVTLSWAIPSLLAGLLLLVLTRKRERVLSLTRRADDP
jgi:hypothetical protein